MSELFILEYETLTFNFKLYETYFVNYFQSFSSTKIYKKTLKREERTEKLTTKQTAGTV